MSDTRGTVFTRERDEKGEPISYEGEIERTDEVFVYLWWTCEEHGRERVLIPLDNVSSIHLWDSADKGEPTKTLR